MGLKGIKPIRSGLNEILVKTLLWVVFGVWTAFLVIPLLALFLELKGSYFWLFKDNPVAVKALVISLTTTSTSVLLIVLAGLPTAYLLARKQTALASWWNSVLDLPMVLPPAVAGVLLLMAFGRNGLIGSLLNGYGINITFSWVAVVLAQCFIAGPLFLKNAITGFKSVSVELEETALTLGKNPWQVFWQVTFPLALPSLITGLALAWARALGEFGATIIFAGNLPGRTQTLPLAIYTAMENDFPLAMTLSAMMVVISLVLLSLIRFLDRRKAGGIAHADH